MFVTNQDRFDGRYYEQSKFIQQFTELYSQQFDKTQPNFGQAHIYTTEIQDDIAYLQMTGGQTYRIYGIEFNRFGISFDNSFPENYKVVGYQFYRDKNMLQINRQTYGILNFFGDVGGLDGILALFGILLT